MSINKKPKFYFTVKKPKDYKSLSELTLEWRDSVLNSFNTANPKKITARHTEPIIARIKKISLGEWAAIWTVIAGIIALWVYVISPIISGG